MKDACSFCSSLLQKNSPSWQDYLQRVDEVLAWTFGLKLPVEVFVVVLWPGLGVLSLLSPWHCHFDCTLEGKLILLSVQVVFMFVCVCARAHAQFVHVCSLTASWGACKSGKFLAQLVPAVSIPCVHVSVCVRVRVSLRRVKVVSRCHHSIGPSEANYSGIRCRSTISV